MAAADGKAAYPPRGEKDGQARDEDIEVRQDGLMDCHEDAGARRQRDPDVLEEHQVLYSTHQAAQREPGEERDRAGESEDRYQQQRASNE